MNNFVKHYNGLYELDNFDDVVDDVVDDGSEEDF